MEALGALLIPVIIAWILQQDLKLRVKIILILLEIGCIFGFIGICIAKYGN